MTEVTTLRWSEREQPDIQVYDVDTATGQYTDLVHAVGVTAPSSDAVEFVEHLNDIREPLHKDARQLYTPHTLRFYGGAVATDIAELTGQPPYPAYRGVYREEIPLLGYNDGNDDEITAGYSDEELDALYGIVRLPRRVLEEGDAVDAFDAVVSAIGAASLRGPVDIYLDDDRHPDLTYGSLWRHDGQVIGKLLCRAAVAKVSSIVRQEYGVTAPADTAPSPLLEQYYHPHYAEPDAVMAAGIDLINHAAGYTDGQYGFYEALWAFAKDGRDENARQAMEAVIDRATGGNGGLRLEHLEAQTDGVSLPIGLLHRIEEACNIELRSRLSRVYA